MFHINGKTHPLLADAAQEAECLHAEKGSPQEVRAQEDCPQGGFLAGEVVYTSLGPVEGPP